MRQLVLEQRYIVTLHADEEMDVDGLSVYDVESIVLCGQIIERQRDVITSEYKYRIRGKTLAGSEAEVITKLSVTGKLVFITAYSLQ
jgi:hypothetical protein